MSRLKRVAQELAGTGRADLAREVALASLEFKQRTKLASGIDYMRESDELAQRYCEEVAAKLAKELGGTVSRSNSEVLVLGPAHGSPTGSKKPFIKIFLEYKRLNFAFDDLQGHKDVLAFAATDSDAVVSKTVSALSKMGVLIGTKVASTRTASVDSLQRKVDEIANAIQKVTAELKQNGSDPALENKLERLRTQWTTSLMALDQAVMLEMDSIPFDDDSFR